MGEAIPNEIQFSDVISYLGGNTLPLIPNAVSMGNNSTTGGGGAAHYLRVAPKGLLAGLHTVQTVRCGKSEEGKMPHYETHKPHS